MVIFKVMNSFFQCILIRISCPCPLEEKVYCFAFSAQVFSESGFFNSPAALPAEGRVKRNYGVTASLADASLRISHRNLHMAYEAVAGIEYFPEGLE